MTGFHHVGLSVADLQASIDFYCDLFGCRVVERGESEGGEVETVTGLPGAHMRMADLAFPSGHILELIQYLAPRGSRLEQRTCDAGNTHFAIRVDDIDAAVADLQDQGVEVHRVPLIAGSGHQAFLHDPFGNMVELNEPE